MRCVTEYEHKIQFLIIYMPRLDIPMQRMILPEASMIINEWLHPGESDPTKKVADPL